jgi:hypothetical protein
MLSGRVDRSAIPSDYVRSMLRAGDEGFTANRIVATIMPFPSTRLVRRTTRRRAMSPSCLPVRERCAGATPGDVGSTRCICVQPAAPVLPARKRAQRRRRCFRRLLLRHVCRCRKGCQRRVRGVAKPSGRRPVRRDVVATWHIDRQPNRTRSHPSRTRKCGGIVRS